MTEIERAEYRLSMSYLKAGDAEQALVHANECLRICTENGALPLDMFFAHEALVLVHRSLCVSCKDKVKPAFQDMCKIP